MNDHDALLKNSIKEKKAAKKHAPLSNRMTRTFLEGNHEKAAVLTKMSVDMDGVGGETNYTRDDDPKTTMVDDRLQTEEGLQAEEETVSYSESADEKMAPYFSVKSDQPFDLVSFQSFPMSYSRSLKDNIPQSCMTDSRTFDSSKLTYYSSSDSEEILNNYYDKYGVSPTDRSVTSVSVPSVRGASKGGSPVDLLNVVLESPQEQEHEFALG